MKTKDANFNRFEFRLTSKDAVYMSHPGDCYLEILACENKPYIVKQFAKIIPAHIIQELRESGAWDETELESKKENQRRILWIAAGNIREALTS